MGNPRKLAHVASKVSREVDNPHEPCKRLDPPLYRPKKWLPERFRVVDEIAPHVRKATVECLTGRSPWPLLFYGEVGSGKTCAGLVMTDIFGGYYLTVDELVEHVNETTKTGSTRMYGGSLSRDELWDSLKAERFVVLDELGMRANVTEPRYVAIKRLIDARHGKPTVLISNLPLQSKQEEGKPRGPDLASAYDDRIASRIAEGTRVRFEGDRRPRKQ